MVKSRFCCLALLVGAACLGAPRDADGETVLLDFTAPHCAPCREMDPVLRQMSAQGYLVQSIDVSRQGDVATRYGVTRTPTFVVLVDGREWARLVGKTSHAQLVEMVHKATALAGAQTPTARGPRGGGAVSAIDFAPPRQLAADANVPATFTSGPQEGRVVPIQDPFAVRATPRRPPSPTTLVPTMPPAAAADDAALIAATVRLSMTDPDGRSTGTGVIVDARNGMALVLTCGHIFRESNGTGPIEVSLFTPAASGAELRGTVVGELLDFDLDRDLALVRIRSEEPLAFTPIAPAGAVLEPGAVVTSVGCSHGENPTAWASRITAINRYQGHPNVEAAGAPVEGRSGGGLFNAQGQLVGICFAADPHDDEGLYASLPSIHAKLDELQMSAVYQSPGGGAGGAAATHQVAAAAPRQPSFEVRGQDATTATATTLPAGWPETSPTVSTSGSSPAASGPPAMGAAPPALSAAERAALEEIARRGSGVEVICIIRPHGADGRSQVIKLDGASPAFVGALTAAAGGGGSAP